MGQVLAEEVYRGTRSRIGQIIAYIAEGLTANLEGFAARPEEMLANRSD